MRPEVGDKHSPQTCNLECCH